MSPERQLELVLNDLDSDALRFLADRPSLEDFEARFKSSMKLSERKCWQLVQQAPGESHERIAYCWGFAAARQSSMRQGAAELIVSAPFEHPHSETAAAIISLISSAQDSLRVASYVLGHIEEVLPLLKGAAERGVDVRLIVDSKSMQNSSGAAMLSELSAVASSLQLRIWREESAGGVMHAKYLVADGSRMLITSANLTGKAITRNIEAGLLISEERSVRHAIALFEAIWAELAADS